jgi:hypothetical protein
MCRCFVFFVLGANVVDILTCGGVGGENGFSVQWP